MWVIWLGNWRLLSRRVFLPKAACSLWHILHSVAGRRSSLITVRLLSWHRPSRLLRQRRWCIISTRTSCRTRRTSGAWWRDLCCVFRRRRWRSILTRRSIASRTSRERWLVAQSLLTLRRRRYWRWAILRLLVLMGRYLLSFCHDWWFSREYACYHFEELSDI